MKKFNVYQLVNEQGKIEYIGQTTNIKTRMRQHKSINGNFTNRNDIKVEIVKSFNDKKEAYYFEGKMKNKNGFIWTEKTTRQINGEKNGIAVLVFNYKTGEFIGEFTSGHAAARLLGLNQGNVTSVVKGNRNSTGGYKIKYKV